jgi:hypothetical protein
VLLLAGEAYFVCVSASMTLPPTDSRYKMASLWLPRTAKLYTTTRATLAVFCEPPQDTADTSRLRHRPPRKSPLAPLTQLAVLVNGVACLLNFGKGLLPAHEARRRRAVTLFTPAREKTEDRQVEERLVID